MASGGLKSPPRSLSTYSKLNSTDRTFSNDNISTSVSKLTSRAHAETLNILNTHATVRAKTEKTGTNEFYTRFAEFIYAFEENSQQVNYLTGDPNATRTAYDLALNCKLYNEDEGNTMIQSIP